MVVLIKMYDDRLVKITNNEINAHKIVILKLYF